MLDTGVGVVAADAVLELEGFGDGVVQLAPAGVAGVEDDLGVGVGAKGASAESDWASRASARFRSRRTWWEWSGTGCSGRFD